MFRQPFDSNAFRAALTARSTSALSPSATRQITSPVVGLIVSKVLPDTLSTHFPPISIFWFLTFGGAIGSIVAVVMFLIPLGKSVPNQSRERLPFTRGVKG